MDHLINSEPSFEKKAALLLEFENYVSGSDTALRAIETYLHSKLFTNDYDYEIVSCLSDTLFEHILVNISSSAEDAKTASFILQRLVTLATHIPDGKAMLSSVLNLVGFLGRGRYGSVNSGTFNNVEGRTFAIKTAFDENLQHELLVSAYALNNLRDLTKAFVSNFATFSCNDINFEKGLPMLCSEESFRCEQHNHMLMEYVQGKTIDSLIKKNEIEGIKYVQILKQLVGALQLADIYCEFKHNDLHSGNVLLERSKTPTRVYIGNNTYTYTHDVVRIVDYGWASVSDLRPLFTRFEGNDILSDVHKFLLFSAEYAQHSQNYSVYDACALMYTFFSSSTTLEDRLLMRRLDKNDYYVLKGNSSRTFGDFLTFIDNTTTNLNLKVETENALVVAQNLKGAVLNLKIFKMKKRMQTDPFIFVFREKYLSEVYSNFKHISPEHEKRGKVFIDVDVNVMERSILSHIENMETAHLLNVPIRELLFFVNNSSAAIDAADYLVSVSKIKTSTQNKIAEGKKSLEKIKQLTIQRIHQSIIMHS